MLLRSGQDYMRKACGTRSAVPGTQFVVPGGHCQAQAVRSRGGLGSRGTKEQGPRPDFRSLGMSGWRSTGYPSTHTRLRALPVCVPPPLLPPRQDGGVRAGRVRGARRGRRWKGDIRRVQGGGALRLSFPEALLPATSPGSAPTSGRVTLGPHRAVQLLRPGWHRAHPFPRKKSWPPPPPGTFGDRRWLPLPQKPAALVKA